MAREKICCIYGIVSKIHPERMYVGSAIDVIKRWSDHRSSLLKQKHHSSKLQRHVNKYGIDDLIFYIIIICEKSELIPVDGIVRPEQFFIWAYNPYFNIAKIAGTCHGQTLTREHKRKIGIGNKGKIHSPETLQKQSESHKGIHPSKETREKMSIASTGRHASKESIEKRAAKRRGTHPTPEALANMSKCRMGIKTGRKVNHSKEVRDKISQSLKKTFENHPEMRNHLSEIQKGKKLSAETTKKMSVSQKERRRREREK